jgi:hypothetical protein
VKKKVYQSPELQHIGEASQVVLGLTNVGGDVYGEIDYEGQEFEND